MQFFINLVIVEFLFYEKYSDLQKFIVEEYSIFLYSKSFLL